MNTTAPIPPHEKALALATKRAIQSAGGLELCEQETGISDTQLSRCSNVNLRDSITIRDAVTVDNLAGQPLILKAMARQLGHLVIPLPQTSTDPDTLAATVLQLAAEFGDVSRSVHDAIRDGKVTAEEAAHALAELDQLDEVSARLRLALGRVSL
jgi:hypothetical protein